MKLDDYTKEFKSEIHVVVLKNLDPCMMTDIVQAPTQALSFYLFILPSSLIF